MKGIKGMSGGDNGPANELRTIMSQKLRDEGWDNIKQFMVSTKVPFSLETVRRAFNACDYKNLEASTLAIIMKYLNYTPNEIKHLLMTYTSDRDLVELIGDGGHEYTLYEQRLVEAYRAIIKANPSLSAALADQIDLVGRLAGVSTKKYTDALRR